MIGAIVFIFLFCVRLAQGGFGIPLAAQSLLAAVLLVFRKPVRTIAPWWHSALAWSSAFLPLGMAMPQALAWAGLPGLLLSLWAMLSLGTTFDVAPADRALTQRGAYRYLRHPMYAGELLSCLGVCAVQPSTRNLVVTLAFAVSLLFRIHEEERIVTGYADYAQIVRWRLVPGVW
jgi:protein-S-isoprenylcysteine O-methyltransferase Ste14